MEKETEKMQHEVMIVNWWITCFARKCVLGVNLDMSGEEVASLEPFLGLHASCNGSGEEAFSKIIIVSASMVARS